MNTFHTTHRVQHRAEDMYELVAAVEDYPLFVPLCSDLKVRSREHHGAHDVLIANMTVAYKFIQETFTSRVTLDPRASQILVEYLDGPFRHLENRWRFRKVGEGVCDVEFFIEYEFRSRSLQLLMGALFDKAFRKFVDAFEARADTVYGTAGAGSHPTVTAT
jgi:coenzyme Q-binding protein COQ10